METLWGLLVIVCALALIVPVVWWSFKQDDREFAEENGDTQVIRHPAITGTDETQVIEPLIVDCRPVEAQQQAPVVDELGEWYPWEHEMDEPMLLGHVLMAGSWGTLNARELGMVTA